MMASVILIGLIYFICEMYIDDCILYAKGNTQFLERLEILFKRFQEKNIFLKASKCKFGLATVEYIGRQISKDGITMSDTKINSVLDFPKPVNNTSLRSFLGLANYFRDFVPNHSNVVNPLHKMIDYSASKQAKLTWTEAGEKAFKDIKLLISKSPTLYFISDTAPIILMTDASDYGVGGYLYQLIDGSKQLVALVSKALTIVQLKWSVIQKEAYAIYFCCTALDKQLRDRKFTILTDHKNLTFIKQGSNPMVVRWHLALQELDFTLEYVKGVENTIADAMSRLCINNTPPKPEIAILSAINGTYILSDNAHELIEKCHNKINGHGGVKRTMHKLKLLKVKWPNMRLDVKTFIRECPCCQKMSQIKVPIQAYKYVTSTYRPMECLNIDFIGPYPDKGYVLVIIDCFTRWVELFAVPEATAHEACLCLIQHFGRYGSPTIIRSDKGSHFANELIAQFLAATGTLQNLTLAYSSQENAIVERNNKEINRHLRALTFHTNTVDNYQLGLPFVQRIMNSSHNERTEIAPFQILFGNSVDLERGILTPFEEILPTPVSLTKTSSDLLSLQQHYITIAKDILQKSDAEHIAKNSAQITEFAPNTYVLVQNHSAPETRLHTLWRGPMKVIKSIKGQYTLLDLTTLKEKEYHSTQLKEFIFNPARVAPLDVARKDYLEFFIEKILHHTGNTNRLSSLNFKVKWQGYDDTYNSYEPWKNLRSTEQLHLYLIRQNLKHLIPKQHQASY
jgi:transposase InsO family protein